MKGILAAAISMVLLAAASAHAEFYRWVDREGKEFFTNEPQKIPLEYRDRAEKVTPDDSRVSVENKPMLRGTKTAKAAAHKDKDGRGEEYWRKKASILRTKLRDQQDEYAAAVKELNSENSGKPSKKKRASLEKKTAKLEREIAKTKRKLEVELPEEARKADAYPGWIRE